MRVARSFGQLGDPGQEFQGALHVGGGDGPGVLRGGFLQGSLGQVIQESGQAVASGLPCANVRPEMITLALMLLFVTVSTR